MNVSKKRPADYSRNWESFVMQIPDYALYLLDTSGRIMSWNLGAERLKGYTAKEVLGHSFSDFFTPEERAADKPGHALDIATQRGSYEEEGLRPRRDGTSFWGTSTTTALKDSDGKLEGFARLTRDISEAKKRESALQAARGAMRTLFENSLDGILLTRPADGVVLAANSAACQLFGYSEQQLLSMNRDNLLLQTDSRFAQAWEERSTTGAVAAELTFIRKGGEQFEGRVASKLFVDETGQRLSYTSIQDITEQKRTGESLRASEEKYRTLFDNMTEGFVTGEPIYDSAGNIIDLRFLAVNQAFYVQTGIPTNVVGRLFREVVPRIEQSSIDRYANVARTGKPERFDSYNADTRRHYDVYAFSPNPGKWAALGRDITEEKRAEQVLKDSEHRLAMAMEASATAVWEIDIATGIFHGDDRAYTMLGFAPGELRTRKDWASRIHADEQEDVLKQVHEVIEGQRAHCRRELRFRAKDGSWVWVDSHIMAAEQDAQGRAVRLIGTHTDITERKLSEQALRESEERFRLLYEKAPIGVVRSDQDRRIASVNPKFLEIFGYAPQEIIGLSFIDIVFPEDRAAIAEFTEKLCAGEIETGIHERRMPRKDGTAIWVRVNARMIPDKHGVLREGITLFEDITEKMQAEAALRQSEEKFRATFEHAPLGIAEATLDGMIIDVNSKLIEILGYSKDEMLGLSSTALTHAADLLRTMSNLQELAKGKMESYATEKRYIRKDRSLVWVNVTTSLVAVDGKAPYMVAMIEDITARKRIEEDLKRAMELSYHQATHDMLTGLANRAAFQDRLREALAYAKRDGHLVALHLLDLDRFKSINDTLGHHTGDLLLKEVAKRIKSQVRSTDLSARLGGDEFVLIQTHLTEQAAAGILAEKMVMELGRPYMLEDQEVQSGASIGIALFPNDADEPEEMIKNADLALYEAKHRGRSNFQFYRQELGAAFNEAQRLEHELERALRDQQFCLHYQPQFDMKNGRIAGLEALLRWRHPTRGTLPAVAFIHQAERARLILSIGEWVLQTACRQYKQWIDIGLSVPLTLNLSLMQLRDPRLLETLDRVLAETGLPPSMLQLEMCESVLWDPKFPKDLLHRLKERGLHLALDDFGNDMTMLPTLDRFPLDAVKTEKRLVSKLPHHQPEAAMLAAIVDIAHHLDIAVCAEGVETDAQFAAVKAQGCDFAQGYLLSAPLDADETRQLIEAELAH